MGKFRSKLKGQTKGKRWSKGQSSSSNPQTKRYRDQAKSRFFQENLGPSGLTSDALKKHDAVQSLAPAKAQNETQMDHMEDEQGSSYSSMSSYKTMQTFASEWSDCTNMSFNRFLKVFRSDSALHKEMLAILAAITDIIKQNGGTESPTEYFCLLMTTLEQMMSVEEKNEEQLTAAVSLLSMGIKTVPVAVLRTQFNAVTDRVLAVLNEYSNGDNNVIVKSALGVLGFVLRSQELAVWTHSQTQRLFNALLNPFCVHTKPKWRKTAQQATAGVVHADVFKTSEFNPAADCVAEFCEQTISACLGTNSNNTVLVSSIQAGQTTILHTLSLMKETITKYSRNHMKSCCEDILKLMALNYPIVTSCGLQVLHSLFSSQQAVVSSKLNGQLISALYDYQPSAADVQPTLAWLTVMQQAHVHLSDVDLNISISALPKAFNVVTQLWLSQKPEVVMGATRAIEVMLKDALAPVCATEDYAKQYSEKLSKCFQSIELGLSYQYHHAWHQILHVTAVMCEVGGIHCSDLLISTLKTLSELRDSYKFSYNNELEYAVGAAIRSMGPAKVLSVISLQKDNGEVNLDRSWLIPVLRENIRNSTLAFWVQSILPMATFCQKRSVELAAVNNGIGAHSAELLHLQLWNLLPSFCNNPSDISTGFKGIAKVLGVAISDRKELRLSVMACLRKLITSAKENENNEDINELARYDKNYLPILFNLYTTKPIGTDEEGQRLAALDTIKVYLTIARTELANELFKNALERVSKITDPEETYVKESVLDLIRALIPYQPVENIQILYDQCINNLPEITNQKEQKKAYRLLEELCGNNAEGCKEFLKNNRKSVQKLLKKSLTSASVTSKGARIRCLNYLLQPQKQLDHESILIRTSIPEAVLCCKDVNGKCRASAYDLLNTIGEILQDHNQMDQYVTMVIAGLAGNPQMITCTILALASILHNFTGGLGQQNISLILENVLQLMAVPTREIVSACLSFIKVYRSSLPSPTVASSLSQIVTGVSKMTDDCKRHFRMKVRNLLERLVRKYGSESITPHIPTSDVVMYKQLRNIRKLQNRLKRKKQEEDKKEEDVDMEEEYMVKSKTKSIEEILADSDSDFDDEGEMKNKPTSQRKYNAYIEENADDIVDFNDPSVVSKITASMPGSSNPQNAAREKKQKKDRGFKTAADGRLIIADNDDSDDSDSGKNKKKNKIGFNSDSDSDDDALSTAETDIMRDRKRKRSSASSVASSMVSSKVKYQPGGSGIHRNVSSSAGSVKSFAGSEYRSKKAAGDVKKKGKMDPYAYLPLQRSALNKRKKRKHIGEFKGIVSAAKSGAKKGMKSKRSRK